MKVGKDLVNAEKGAGLEVSKNRMRHHVPSISKCCAPGGQVMIWTNALALEWAFKNHP